MTAGRCWCAPGPGVPHDADALRAENGRLREANERLRMLLEAKDAKIADLEERIARLERLISRNSGNSSVPPSTDDLPGRKPPERRAGRGGGRKPGKQPGAPGAYLAWSQDPDTIVEHFPQGRCTCGADLSGAADLGVRYSHQVTDLPDARTLTVQHDRHEARYGCGRVHVAGAPPEATGAPGTVTYGLNFQAWCVFLMVMHHVPVERCADTIESMAGTRPSRVPGAKSKQPPARTLLECLRHREADVLRFLTDTAIPPTSNQAERDLRPSKTQQKISGRLRSEKTTRDRYAIRGYASTAVKHGIAVLTVIRDALAGDPWIPPIPATN